MKGVVFPILGCLRVFIWNTQEDKCLNHHGLAQNLFNVASGQTTILPVGFEPTSAPLSGVCD